MKRKVMYVFIGIILLYGVNVIGPKKEIEGNNPWRTSRNDTLVISHAGGRLYNPGNTMSAFEYSYNLGVDVLEMDVQMTNDGVLVLRHGENETGNIRQMSNCDTVIWDETFEYLYNNCNFGYNYEDIDGEFPYRDMTHSEWVDAGVYLLRLEALFIEYGNSTLYVVEIKADADAQRNETADALVDLIKAYHLDDFVLLATSFEDISLYIRDTYPDMMISASHAKAQETVVKTYSLTDMFLNPDGYYALQIPTSENVPVVSTLPLDKKLLINRLHNHNMAVHYWTINDELVMKELIELGADGIITDDPALLIEVINNIE